MPVIGRGGRRGRLCGFYWRHRDLELGRTSVDVGDFELGRTSRDMETWRKAGPAETLRGYSSSKFS